LPTTNDAKKVDARIPTKNGVKIIQLNLNVTSSIDYETQSDHAPVQEELKENSLSRISNVQGAEQ
jgi:hypothetical protein